MPSIAYVPPALYRYPGPCGLVEWFAGTMALLAPPGPELWLCERPIFEDTVGARHFGTLLLGSPRRYRPVPSRPGIWLGVNGPPFDVEWVPPSTVTRSPAPPSERSRVIDSLCLYIEELDAMRRTGTPGPGVPWCQVPMARRLAMLSAHGVAPVWTRSPAVRTCA